LLKAFRKSVIISRPHPLSVASPSPTL